MTHDTVLTSRGESSGAASSPKTWTHRPDHLHALRRRFVDAPDSMGQRFRARRWQWLLETFPQLPEMSVVDLGGTADSWLRAPVRPAAVHVVNLEEPPADLPPWLRADLADACDLPGRIAATQYDLVVSNSVIEHVGGHHRRRRFAETVSGLADRYWVQTPYRYFPVEPHWLCPGVQFLPVAARARLVRHWPLVHTPLDSDEQALGAVLGVELLSRTEMRTYFPDAELRSEKVAGLAKSLVAVRQS
ncbi:hypothetical protein SAMN05421678_11125 [Actinopolymorpha cephalotaxi]|uniref:Methyltransferase domain-containing protein n=1 Tax=Actinopolymorpha cephalotaxi TaxID=504797 RepID=A0A1I2WQL9_9ACTN|nr:hypothetical protein [Actinopolymorpha cephalotaxi]NYH85053.1 hypothetical protein [Actinopolymorpha cephalotaxi]SFH02929.1 hypothetical protein SAMN05421678_11125 [Actinopolymorpha cephalotaxi]